MRIILSIVLIIFGFFLGAVCYYYALQIKTGLVHREKYSRFIVESGRILPDIIYTNAEGTEKKAHLDSGSYSQFKPGDQIFFYLYPKNPEFATPDNFLNLYFLQLLGGIFSVLVIIIGIFVLSGKLSLMGATFSALAALIIALWGFGILKGEFILQTKGTLITGKVVDINSKKEYTYTHTTGNNLVDRKKGWTRYLKFQYYGPQNQLLQVTIADQDKDYKVGDEIPLVADFSSRPIVAIHDWKSFITGLFLVSLFSIMFTAAAVIFWFVFIGKIRP